jgi:hypothetical protein
MRSSCMGSIDRLCPRSVEMLGVGGRNLVALIVHPSVICAGREGLGRYMCGRRVAFEDRLSIFGDDQNHLSTYRAVEHVAGWVS